MYQEPEQAHQNNLDECLGLMETMREQDLEYSTERKLWIVLNVKTKGEVIKL